MATQVQRRRGNTAQNNAFLGALGELAFNTELIGLRLHDGVTVGGHRVAMFSDIVSPPFADTTNIVRGSVDPTKLLRFEVDGFTAATTRTLTPQNADYILAGTNVSNTFSVMQLYGAGVDIGNVGGATGFPRAIYASTSIWAPQLMVGGSGVVPRGLISAPANSVMTLVDQTAVSFGRLTFGPATSSFPSLKRSAAVLQVRLADDSAYAAFDVLELRASGTKVVGAQSAAVADAAGGAVIDAEARTALNALLARLRTHGLIATS